MLGHQGRLLALLGRTTCSLRAAALSRPAQEGLCTQQNAFYELQQAGLNATGTSHTNSAAAATGLPEGLNFCLGHVKRSKALSAAALVTATWQERGKYRLPAVRPISSSSSTGSRHSSNLGAEHGGAKSGKGRAGGVYTPYRADGKKRGAQEAFSGGCNMGPGGQGGLGPRRSSGRDGGRQGGHAVDGGSGRGVCAAAYAPYIVFREKSFVELQQLLQQYGSRMKWVQLTAMMSRLKSVQGGVPEKVALLKQLLELLEPQLHHCQPRGLGEVMLTCSKLGYGGDQLYNRCLGFFVSKLRQADARTLANVVYAVATAQHDSTRQQCWPVLEEQLLPAFIKAVTQGEGQPQNIANVVWGVAAMGQQLPAQQVQLLVGGLVAKLEAANPQHVANVLWAVAAMGGVVPAEQLQQLLKGVFSTLVTANPQEIANLLWGVAKMQQQVPADQLQRLLTELAGKLARAKPQEISNAVWGVAKMGQQVPAKQLTQLVGAMLGKAQEIVPQSISNLIWGIATMGQQVPVKPLSELLTILASKLGNSKPQEVANTIWGVASLQPQPFFPAVLLEAEAKQAILSMVPAMIPQDLANIALACGWLSYKDDKLLPALFDTARQALTGVCGTSNSTSGPNSQELANMCWAAAVLDMQQLISHVEQFAAAVSSIWLEAAAEEKHQLYQVHMWLLDQQGNSRGLSACLTEQQLHGCREQWQKQLLAATSANASSAQRAVFEAAQHLQGLSCLPQQEAVTADGLHSIDVLVVTAEGMKVAIEVDSAHHFRQPDLQPTGSTQWRNRSLAARGYVVVSVPYWEWDKLPTSQRVTHLENKVQQGVLEACQSPPAAAAAAVASPLSQASSSSRINSNRTGAFGEVE